MNKTTVVIMILWFAIALLLLKVCVLNPASDSEIQKQPHTFAPQSAQQDIKALDKHSFYEIDNNLKSLNGNIGLNVNPVSDYDNLSKEDIYSLRKKYVSESLFSYNGYEPSEEVFGQIQSYKPWYGLTYSGCIVNTIGTNKVIEGPSEESRFVNNPNMLVGIVSGAQDVPLGHSVCFDKDFWAMPESMSYDSTTKTITAIYNFRYKGYYILTGINARDFGYRYVFADKVENFKFRNTPNISEQVFEFVDYIHLGGSCKFNDGCNNGSPHQRYLDFTFDDFPAELHIKLFRERPSTTHVTPDINYKIIFK